MEQLSTTEASERSGISIRTLQYACAQGEIKAKRWAGRLVINARSLDKYVAAKADRLSRRGRKPKGSPAPR